MDARKIMLILLICLAVPGVLAANVQPLDCSKLASGMVSPKTEFTEEETLCFYGTGYAGGEQVTVSLENDDRELPKEVTISQGGVLSSVTQSLGGLIKGIYNLLVKGEGFSIRYPSMITVTGTDTTPGDGDGGDGGDGQPAVPEFTAIAAGIALAGTGFIIYRRRKGAEE